jgi:hypothetical protein
MGLTRLLTGTAAALACLTGCATHPATPAASATVAADLAVSDVAPEHLTYTAVGVDADVDPTGLNTDGTIRVPALDKAAEVDYLDWGTKVGAGRPLVFVCHINGRDGAGKVIPGGFGRLAHAAVGDMVTVTGRSGAQARYRVARVRTVAKAQFPTSVYDPTPTPTLVLITCGGQLLNHNYLSNVIVTADAVA